jgi:hypothetical protein
MANGIFVGSQRHFYWNIDANVGPGCPNNPEDVQLVQLAFACRAANTARSLPAADRAIYAAVVPGAPYAGGFNDPLTKAIRCAQKARGGVQDGHVSVIKSSTGGYAENMTYMLIALNNNMVAALGNTWPHVDRHPLCPAALKQAVARLFYIPVQS